MRDFSMAAEWLRRLGLGEEDCPELYNVIPVAWVMQCFFASLRYRPLPVDVLSTPTASRFAHGLLERKADAEWGAFMRVVIASPPFIAAIDSILMLRGVDPAVDFVAAHFERVRESLRHTPVVDALGARQERRNRRLQGRGNRVGGLEGKPVRLSDAALEAEGRGIALSRHTREKLR